MPIATQAVGVAVATPAASRFASPAHIPLIQGGNMQAKQTAATRNTPARAAMARVMQDYFERHRGHVDAADAARAENRQRAAGQPKIPMPSPLPPLGLAATVGLGKSQGVQAVAEPAYTKGLPILVLVPTHELAQPYLKQLRHLGDAVRVYQGRRAPSEEPGNPGAHACYQLDPVATAGDMNHRPAQSLCKKCAHGASGVIHFVTRDQMRIQRAQELLKSYGLREQDVPPCQFLFMGLPDQMAAQIVIAPIQAFSEALAVWKEVEPETGFALRETQRLVIIDEHIPLSKEIPIHGGDVAGWRRRLCGLQDSLRDRSAGIERKGELTEDEQADLEKIKALHDLLPQIDHAFAELGAAIALDRLPGQALSETLIGLHKQAGKLGGVVGGTAAWERIGFDAEANEFHIPLRALGTLANNLLQGTLRVGGQDDEDKACLFSYETSPVVEWAQAHGSTVFMDATMGDDMHEFITKAGGWIHHARAEQNMRVTRYTGRLYSRGDVRQTEEYLELAKARMTELAQIAQGMERPAAIITHKAYLKYSADAWRTDEAAEQVAQAFQDQTGVGIGWFGKHDRGLNIWSGHHVALVGMPLLSKAAVAGLYAATRNAMVNVGLCDQWPVWDGVMDKEKPDAEGPPLPLMPSVRAWLMDTYAQGVAQAIGRNRAVNRDGEPLQVDLWGGIQSEEMDRALLKYGITIHGRQLNPMSKTGPKHDENAVREAIDMILATGGRVSERAVRQALMGMRKKASNQAIRGYLRNMRDAGTVPAAVRVNRGQDAHATPPESPRIVQSESVESLPCAIEIVDSDPVEDQSKSQDQGTPLRGRERRGQEKGSGGGVDAAAVAVAASAGATADAAPISLPLALPLTAPNSHIKQREVWELGAVAPDAVAGSSLSLPLPLPSAVQCHDRIGEAVQSGEPRDPAFDDWLEDMMLQVAADIEADLAAEAAAEADAAGGPGGSQERHSPDCHPSRITECGHGAS